MGLLTGPRNAQSGVGWRSSNARSGNGIGVEAGGRQTWRAWGVGLGLRLATAGGAQPAARKQRADATAAPARGAHVGCAPVGFDDGARASGRSSAIPRNTTLFTTGRSPDACATRELGHTATPIRPRLYRQRYFASLPMAHGICWY